MANKKIEDFPEYKSDQITCEFASNEEKVLLPTMEYIHKLEERIKNLEDKLVDNSIRSVYWNG